MGLFKTINNHFTDKRLKKLERDLTMIRSRLNFNPFKAIKMDSQYNTQEYFTQRIQEFKVLASGNAAQINQYYSSVDDDNNLNFFWVKAPSNVMKVHAGFPKLICDKMATLGTCAGINETLEVFKTEKDKDGNMIVDDDLTAKVTDLWDSIREKTNFMQQVKQMWFTDAMVGHDIVKLNYDLDASQYPIIEVRDLSTAEVVKYRGVTKEIIFHSWFTKKSNGNDVNYRFDETYATNKEGYAIIKNELFKMSADGGSVQVPLNTIEETAYLMNDRKPEESNPLTFIQTFEGLKGMIAFDKPNKLPNTEFPDSAYGMSDITATDCSDKLDEIVSEIASECRNNKGVTYIPDDMIPTNEYGKKLNFNPFITRYQKISGSKDQGTGQEITTQMVQDKTESHTNQAKIYMDLLCSACGLSPLSLGITCFESIGANVSGDGFRERIKTTLDTRKSKIELFKPYLANIIRQTLALNHFLVTQVGAKQPGSNDVDVDFDNTNVLVDFGEYVGESEQEIINKISSAKNGGFMSIETSVRELHKDWSEDQIMDEVNRIKIENNLTVETPTLLQFGNDGGGVDGANS